MKAKQQQLNGSVERRPGNHWQVPDDMAGIYKKHFTHHGTKTHNESAIRIETASKVLSGHISETIGF